MLGFRSGQLRRALENGAIYEESPVHLVNLPIFMEVCFRFYRLAQRYGTAPALRTEGCLVMPCQRNRLPATPFRNACDGSCFYASATHQEALARLQFLVQQGRSLGILTGGDGSGKSLVLSPFLGELQQTGQPACLINLMGLEPRDFLWELAAGLRAQPRTSDDVFALWRHVIDRIRANHLLHAEDRPSCWTTRTRRRTKC